MIFCPSAATWASTRALAPLPMLTIVMTAPIPMMIPRAVRIERMVLRRRARSATRRMMVKRMGSGRGCGSELGGGFRCLELAEFDGGDAAVLHGFVANDNAVP